MTTLLLLSAQIENFKSIDSSNEFSVKPVTCLVGKNEAGKTTILQALYKLNPDIPEKGNFDGLFDYPRRKWSSYKERKEAQPDNVLTTKWECQPSDIKELEEKFGQNILKNNIVTITKGYDNQLKFQVDIDEKQVLLNWAKGKSFSEDETAEVSKYTTFSGLAALKEANPTEIQKKILNNLDTDFPKGPQTALLELLRKRLPVFLFFSDFSRMAGKVSLNDLQSRKNQNRMEQPYRIFEALLNLAGTTTDQMNGIQNSEALIAELEAISNRLTSEIFEYWSQNKNLQIEFRFECGRPQDPAPYNNGYVFHTRILNTRHGVTVGFDERSQGFVWFFSFLVWFSQLKRVYGDNLFILLDDPGLSLHARAQADLLRYIKEKLQPHYQVIYTTHSPFMIDPENLQNVRTVEDDLKSKKILGTKVSEKVLGTDPDTLFPLQAAIGYDIAQTLFIGKNTLLVEGPSDLLYLKLFSKELESAGRTHLDSKWAITPCGGVEKIASFMALFKGNNLNVAVLTDLHKGIKTRIRSLQESEILKAGHIFTADMYAGKEEADIEDIIGRSNYIKIVNDCYTLDKTHQMPEENKLDSSKTVLEEVETYLKANVPDLEFNHYTPAMFLTENRKELKTLPQISEALDRFEKLFKSLNALF